MRAGQLRNRVTIQTNSEGTANATYGDTSPVWADLVTVWARREWMSGREVERAQAIHPDAKVKFTMRYRSDVTSKMRVKDGSTYYYIGAVLPDERESVLINLFCTVDQ